MRKAVLLSAVLGLFAFAVSGSDILHIFAGQKLVELAPLNTTTIDKNVGRQTKVMLYDPRLDVALNLRNNRMLLWQADAMIASCSGCQIIMPTGNGYILPAVEVTEVLLPDGTPLGEVAVHDEEISSSKLASTGPAGKP